MFSFCLIGVSPQRSTLML